MIVALALAGLVLALALILLFSGRFGLGGNKGELAKTASGRTAPGARTCPLCGSLLGAGETVRSDLSPGTGDRIMRIYGCPHCWEALPRRALESGPARICPYCRGELPREGWVVARYFERPGRRHVHVLGCTRCRPTA